MENAKAIIDAVAVLATEIVKVVFDVSSFCGNLF